MDSVYLEMIQFFLAWTILFLILLAAYFINAIFSYKFAKHGEVSHPFLSWILVIGSYNYFEMIEDDEIDIFGKYRIEKRIAGIFYILSGFVFWLSIFTTRWLFYFIFVVRMVFSAVVFDNLYRSLKLKESGLYTVLSAILQPIGVMTAYFAYAKAFAPEQIPEKERIPEDIFDEPPGMKDDGDDLREAGETTDEFEKPEIIGYDDKDGFYDEYTDYRGDFDEIDEDEPDDAMPDLQSLYDRSAEDGIFENEDLGIDPRDMREDELPFNPNEFKDILDKDEQQEELPVGGGVTLETSEGPDPQDVPDMGNIPDVEDVSDMDDVPEMEEFLEDTDAPDVSEVPDITEGLSTEDSIDDFPTDEEYTEDFEEGYVNPDDELDTEEFFG